MFLDRCPSSAAPALPCDTYNTRLPASLRDHKRESFERTPTNPQDGNVRLPRPENPSPTPTPLPRRGVDESHRNITWHPSLSRNERNELRRQKGFTIWFTGLSASGKSTVATALEQHLLHLGLAAYRLDGDNVRFGLNKDLGFSEKDRNENIRRIAEVSATVHTPKVTLANQPFSLCFR